jgi:hypothetical protein
MKNYYKTWNERTYQGDRFMHQNTVTHGVTSGIPLSARNKKAQLYARYFFKRYDVTVTECARRLDLRYTRLIEFEKRHKRLPQNALEATAKRLNMVEDFVLKYGCSMSQMGKRLGISREAVRKRWVKNPDTVEEHERQQNQHG